MLNKSLTRLTHTNPDQRQHHKKNRPGTQSLATPHFPGGNGHLAVTEHDAQSKVPIGADGLIRKELSYPLRTLTVSRSVATTTSPRARHVVSPRRFPSLACSLASSETTASLDNQQRWGLSPRTTYIPIAKSRNPRDKPGLLLNAHGHHRQAEARQQRAGRCSPSRNVRRLGDTTVPCRFMVRCALGPSVSPHHYISNL